MAAASSGYRYPEVFAVDTSALLLQSCEELRVDLSIRSNKTSRQGRKLARP